MKTVSAFLLLLVTLQVSATENRPVFSSGAYLHCFDGKVELSLEADDVAEIGKTSAKDLFSKNNILRIRTYGQTYTFTENVVVATDGSGNDAVQVFAQDPFGPLIPVMEFTFEHEGNYLSGFFSLPKKKLKKNEFYTTENFGKAIDFNEEDMKCNGTLDASLDGVKR